MEFPLVLHRILALGDSKEMEQLDIQNGGAVVTFGRQTSSFEIPFRAALLQDLVNSRGIPIKLQPNQKLTVPQLTVALGKEDPRDEGFLEVVGLKTLFKELFQGTGHDVKLRVDVDSIRSKWLLLVPKEKSYFFCCANSDPDRKLMNTLKVTPKYVPRPPPIPTGNEDMDDMNYMDYQLEIHDEVEVQMFYDAGNSSPWISSDTTDWEMCISFSLLFDPAVTDVLAVNRKLLDDQVLGDVTIIAANGSQIKCHRSVLAAQSNVFAAGFQKDMKEARAGILEMPDMSEKSVRAFLQFLYLSDTTAAMENPSVCVDLLEAGHKYEIQPLQMSMEQILRSMLKKWSRITPDLLLRLTLFGMNAQLDGLKTILIDLFKSNYDKIVKLTAFQELQKKNAETKTALFEYIMPWRRNANWWCWSAPLGPGFDWPRRERDMPRAENENQT